MLDAMNDAVREAREMAEASLSRAGKDITGLLNLWPEEARVFLLIAMQCTVDSLKPQLSQVDQMIFNIYRGQIETVVYLEPEAGYEQ